MLLVAVLVYWYFALAGTLNIDAKLDTEKILPRNSPLLEPHRLISHMVWTEYYPLTILVNNPVDIRSAHRLARFNAMLAEFEGLKLCKGPWGKQGKMRGERRCFDGGGGRGKIEMQIGSGVHPPLRVQARPSPSSGCATMPNTASWPANTTLTTSRGTTARRRQTRWRRCPGRTPGLM